MDNSRYSAARACIGPVALLVVLGTAASFPRPLVAQTSNPAIAGAWTLNAELSDKPPAPPEGDGRGRGRGGPDGGGRRGGGGGFGGGFGGGRGGFGGPRGAGPAGNPEDMQRRRDAMRDLFDAPERLTITSTGSMVIVTTGDGRTTRLAPDGSKIKDDSTGIERKTRWEAGKLVSEISGVIGGRVTETYAVQPDSGRLEIVLAMQGGDGGQNGRGPGPEGRGPRRRVYDRKE